MMLKLKFTIFSLCLIFSKLLWASPTLLSSSVLHEIKQIRIWPSPESTRIVFDLNDKVEYRWEMKEGNRLIIELKQTRMNAGTKPINLTNTRLVRMETKQVGKDCQASFILSRPLKVNAFLLPPNKPYGHRLVIDLEITVQEQEEILALFEADSEALIALNQTTKVSSQNSTKTTNKVEEKTETMQSKQEIPTLKSERKSPPAKVAANKPFVVAIDPGHGGEDPGAIGRGGTREKDVVLAIAKELKKLIDKEPGMRAVLIRTGDYYVGLADRVARARRHKADLFISIHADAFHNKKAQGASVFTVSERGASSSAAKWLAERENRSDLVGGLSLKGKHPVLASVLLDMTQTTSQKEGLLAAKHVLQSLGKLGSLHRGQVEQAGFLVLKAPDIPSLLVETAFISHPPSESKLKSNAHQKKLAQAILQGIRNFHRQNPRLKSRDELL